MLDVRRLHLLRDLGRLGTIAAVAEAHAYTASAVSQQLAALQREAGVALVERSGRNVRLTPAGLALARHTEDVLSALEAASAGVAAAREGLHGTVRIGAFPSAVRTLLPATLVELAHEHPGLDLTVSELDPASMPGLLRDRRLDVALLQSYDLLREETDPAIEALRLLDEEVFLASLRTQEIEGASEDGWIAGTPGTLCHTVTVRACRDAGFEPRIRHHVDDFTAVLALVAAGQGVALVPQLGAVEVPPGILLNALKLKRRTTMAFRKGAGTHPVTAACVKALRRAVTNVVTNTVR
jgi:DNA-binding transcriptional LysR family regulator